MKTILPVLLLLTSVTVFAQKPPVYISSDGAIRGYDPVAYFKQGKPAKGDEAYTHEWNGAKWSFATEENLKAFKADPDKYAPQFGGYCAWAVSQGYTYEASPQAWKIVDGKLYLNYSKNIQKKWEADQEANIHKANENWPKVMEQ